MRTPLVTAFGAVLSVLLSACWTPPPGGFGLSLTPDALTLNAGSSGSLTVNLERFGDFGAAVSVTVSGLPAGVAAEALVIPASASRGTLVLSVAADAAAGSWSPAVTGTSGATSRQTPLSLGVVREAPGSLDMSFGTGGRYVGDLGGNDFAQALVLQPDGKILAAGFGNGRFALLRLNPDGTPDAGFGDGGRAITVFGDYAEPQALALQPDGKILVAGVSRSAGNYDFAVARYTPQGSLDPDFGSGGKVTTDFGGRDEAYGLALQADGRLVVAGWSAGAKADFALARYRPDGSLDPDFGAGGKVVSDFGGNEGVWALALQPDGKIVAGGFGDGDALARYTPGGSLDPAFGSDGRVDIGGGGIRALAVLPGGKIVAGGVRYVKDFDFALFRYNPDGTPDAGFGAGGVVVSDLGKQDDAYGMALQPGGKIVLAGHSYDGGGGDFALARYTPDGTPDIAFDGDGRALTDFGGYDFAGAVAVQPDGRIVAAGGAGANFALARYWP